MIWDDCRSRKSSNPPEIRREYRAAFSNAFLTITLTRQNAPQRKWPSKGFFFNPELSPREFEITVVISAGAERIYIMTTCSWKKNPEQLCATKEWQRCHAMWKAPVICLAYLRDVGKAPRFSSRPPESRNFFRERRALLQALSLSLSRNNAIVVWILYKAKMHFPRRII